MIECIARYEEGNALLKALVIKGHAAAKGKPGYEVCVSASVLTQGMAKALRRTLPDIHVTYEKREGDLLFERNEALEGESEQAFHYITKGFLIALEELANEFPRYIRFEKEHNNGT